VQKVCKMPDPMSRCRSKVSVKTEIKYPHMHANKHKNTHTKLIQCTRKGKGKETIKKKKNASSRKKHDAEY